MSDLKPVQGLRPFTKFCCTIGNLPASYLASMTYEEQLLWLCDYLQNTVIPTVNNNAEAVEELQNLYIELKNYVNNYFDNLDVQEEINNKLDEMAKDGTLDSIIEKYINNVFTRTYKNVSDMKNDNALSTGMIAKTLSYDSENDLGGCNYEIEDNTNQVVDNGEYILLNNNNIAHLIKPKVLYVSMFGAKGDGQTDDLQSIQNAINYMKFGDTLNLVPNKKYLISNTIHFKKGLNFNGNNSPIFPNANFVAGNYLMSCDQSVTPVEDNYSVVQSLLKNINMQYYGDYKEIDGIYLTYDTTIKNCYFYQIEKCITSSDDYIDFITIEDISIWGHQGTKYAIDTGYIGDSRKIDKVHTHTDSSPNMNILNIGGAHNTIEVSRVINGNINIEGGSVNLHDCHIETGNIVAQKKTKLNISNCYLIKKPNVIPFNFVNIAVLTANNLLVNYRSNVDYTDDTAVDINLPTDKSSIALNNCYKRMNSNSDVTFQHLAGLTTNNSLFNKNKAILSTKGIILGSYPLEYNARSKVGSYNILGTVYKDSNFNFKKLEGNYYYNAIPVFDTNRMVADTSKSSEAVVAVDERSLDFTINYDLFCNLRFYRGSKSGLYNYYVDTTNITGFVIEDGILCNGDKWISRDESAIDTFNNAVSYQSMGEYVIVHMDKIPTVGTWNKNDIIINTNPSEGQPFGWVCVQAGTPGTWKAISTL